MLKHNKNHNALLDLEVHPNCGIKLLLCSGAFSVKQLQELLSLLCKEIKAVP